MNFYTGIDIVFMPRFKEKVLKFSKDLSLENPFIKRLFIEEEIEHILNRKDPFLGLAGRFAAKEASIKAFSKIKKIVSYKDIVIAGEIPYIKEPIFDNIKTSVSISHDKDYAVANVIVVVED